MATIDRSKLPVVEDICKVTVKFSEIDSMRRVWHGSYVKYLEDGRESFGRHYPGIGYADMVEAGILAPIVDVHIQYFAPLGLNDVAVILTRYVPKRGARLDFEYEIRRESDQVLCVKGTTTQLFIDEQEELMLEDPAYYKEWKKRYLTPAE